MAEFSVVTVHPYQHIVQAMHFRQPNAIIAPVVVQHVLEQQRQAKEVHWYTDGSCMYPDFPTSQYGAYSVVLDLLQTDEERCMYVTTQQTFATDLKAFACVAAGRTCGEQDILRSELQAGLCILQQAPYGCLHMDSAVALLLLNKALQAADWRHLMQHEHCDLLYEAWACRDSQQVTFHKVAAHQEHRQDLPWRDRYHSWGNAYADDRAKQTALEMVPDLVHTLEEYHQDHVHQRQLLTIVLKLHLDQHPLRVAATQLQRGDTTKHQRTQQEVHQAFATWAVTPATRFSRPQDTSFLRFCSWGQEIAELMLDWLAMLDWPAEGDTRGPLDQATGTTWLEMTLSFILATRSLLPVLRVDNTGDKRVLRLGSQSHATEYATDLKEQSQNFRLVLENVQALVPSRIWPDPSRRKVQSLYILGHKGYVQGVDCRPGMPHQSALTTILQQRFSQSSSSLSWMPSFELQDKPLLTETGSWQQRSTQATYTMRLVRNARRET
eukprot:Skav203599  [mRNA]  locus=scaffold935:269986:271470:+ [translate_table: standard]